MIKYLLITFSILLLSGCGKIEEKPVSPPVLFSPGPPMRYDIGDNLIKFPLPDDADDIYLQFLKAPGLSFGIMRVRDKLTRRCHDEHDMVFYVHRGNARFHVADKDWITSTGDVVYVPRGAVYSAEIISPGKTFDLFVLYQPIFDGVDLTYHETQEEDKEAQSPK